MEQQNKADATILVINAGSSSIKYSLYNAADMSLLQKEKLEISSPEGYDEAFEDILKFIDDHNVVAVGHRVVHGGTEYSAPQKIDANVLAELEKLEPLAPLHQPHNLKPVKLVMRQYPDMPQVACFDTAFHRTMPRLAELYAIPREMSEQGMIRYGFHGSSYEYIASVLPEHAGAKAKGKVIVAHLGNGASMCAMKDGKSVATTMGFTPLDGLMMGTRTGTLDPGLSLYLDEQKGMATDEISRIFRKESGLKGVSGFSSDMRELLASDKPEAKEAVDLFCLYAARQAGSLAVDLGGLDAVVFTAGIGENAPAIREKICAHLAHLGVEVDDGLNNNNETEVTSSGGKVGVYVIPTNEGLMIARHTRDLALPENDQTVTNAPRSHKM